MTTDPLASAALCSNATAISTYRGHEQVNQDDSKLNAARAPRVGGEDTLSSFDQARNAMETLRFPLMPSDGLNFASATSTTTTADSAIRSTNPVSDQAVYSPTDSVAVRGEDPSGETISADLLADAFGALALCSNPARSETEEENENGGSDQDSDIERELKMARGVALAQHGRLLFEQAIATLDFERFGEAIDVLLDALEHLPEEHPTILTLLGTLGSALVERFDRFSSVNDLEQAVSLLSRAVDLTLYRDSAKVHSSELLPELLHTLGDALGWRFDRLGHIEDTIFSRSRLVDLIPDSHPNMPGVLINLGNAFEARFNRLGKIDDLERAIALKSRSVKLTPDGHSDTPGLLNNLGTVFAGRFNHLGEIGDLEKAISLQLRSVELTPENHPDMPSRLNNLGYAISMRFDYLDEMSDLEQAISLLSRSAEMTPDDHPNKPAQLTSLGDVIELRFSRLGEMGDLEQAISLKSHSVKLASGHHPAIPGLLGSLAGAFQKRFERLGEMGDLEQAISLQSRSIELTPDDHPVMPTQLDSLGDAMELRFGRLGDANDLERAISLKSRSVELTLDDHSSMRSRLTSLGNAISTRFERLGEMSDLEQAISLRLRSVELTPSGHPNAPAGLRNLGIAFETRFYHLGELNDLEQAISLQTRSVELTPDDHPDMPQQLESLGDAIELRFDRLGEMSDLERAISLKSRSVELIPDRHPAIPGLLGSLGGAFMKRFGHLGEMGDLEQSISLKSRSVELTPLDHPDMPGRLTNLGNVLELRFACLGKMEDLERAISLKSRSVDLVPEGHPGMPRCLNNLGSALETRFNRLGKMDDLEYAIQFRRHAINSTPTTDPNLPSYLNNLGRVIQTRFTSAGRSGICPDALKCHEEAMASTTGFSHDRLDAVRLLVDLCWRLQTPDAKPPYDKLVSAYEYAYALIPEVVWLGSSIARRYVLLADISDITRGAAAAAISTGRLTRAVEWMEQGRGIVWGQLLQLRSPMEELSKRHPELAQQLQHISHQLEKSANASSDVLEGSHISGNGIIRPDETTRRIRLARDYKELLSKIRVLEGFDNFLMPKKYAEVAQACESGPVILINTFRSSCDALVCMSADPSRIIPIPLPDFHQEIAQPMLTRSLHFTLLRSHHHERTFWPQPAARTNPNLDESGKRKAVSEVDTEGDVLLYALWRYVVDPILNVVEAELQERTNEDLPHVTWCATGLLASLPIHAAGDYWTPGGMKAFDRVISSYAPSLSSLLRPLRPTQQDDLQPPSSKILAISQSNTVGHSSLPGTIHEMAKLREHFPGDELIHLSESEATVSSVLQSIDEYRCPYIHLACHGTQDLIDPTKSSFILHDGNLELAKLISKSADNATLAFLSACETATGDAKLTEESVHLAAGMLAVGYRGVIGTLWSIHDDDAPLVADEFYRVLKKRRSVTAGDAKGRSRVHAAYALHEAVKKLREQVGESNTRRWAPFVHFGR